MQGSTMTLTPRSRTTTVLVAVVGKHAHLQVARRAEVCEFAAAVAVAQDVLPLNVAVDDALEKHANKD